MLNSEDEGVLLEGFVSEFDEFLGMIGVIDPPGLTCTSETMKRRLAFSMVSSQALRDKKALKRGQKIDEEPPLSLEECLGIVEELLQLNESKFPTQWSEKPLYGFYFCDLTHRWLHHVHSKDLAIVYNVNPLEKASVQRWYPQSSYRKNWELGTLGVLALTLNL